MAQMNRWAGARGNVMAAAVTNTQNPNAQFWLDRARGYSKTAHNLLTKTQYDRLYEILPEADTYMNISGYLWRFLEILKANENNAEAALDAFAKHMRNQLVVKEN